jgi:glycosyltransferase involved in cell wall biosynthesis
VSTITEAYRSNIDGYSSRTVTGGRDRELPLQGDGKPTEVAVSLIVPLFNEEQSVGELYERVRAQLIERADSYEYVFVDDGSRDQTFRRLTDLFADDPEHVRIVRLRRNFGQTAALAAGIDHARGRVVITMDGDLQHAPEDLPKFFEKIDEGYDLVSGWREQRVDNLFLRRIPSRVANYLMAKLSGVRLHDFGTTFKAYRREILDGLELHGELHRFVPALLSWQGISIAEVPIRNVPRANGCSHYGISRTFRVLFDLLTVKFLISYISRPLHVFGFIGGALFALGFMVAAVLSSLYFFFDLKIQDHLGNLMFAMLAMMLGVQFVAMGLTLELGTRTYHAATGKRIYAVREFLTASDKVV